MSETMLDLDGISTRVAAVMQLVIKLAADPLKDFRMSIPARADDADIMLVELCRDARLLVKRVRELERDEHRIDLVERWGIRYCDESPIASNERLVEITGPCHADRDDCEDHCDDESRGYLWSVTGPRNANMLGTRIGEGPSLREAIDDAELEELPAAEGVDAEVTHG